MAQAYMSLRQAMGLGPHRNGAQMTSPSRGALALLLHGNGARFVRLMRSRSSACGSKSDATATAGPGAKGGKRWSRRARVRRSNRAPRQTAGPLHRDGARQHRGVPAGSSHGARRRRDRSRVLRRGTERDPRASPRETSRAIATRSRWDRRKPRSRRRMRTRNPRRSSSRGDRAHRMRIPGLIPGEEIESHETQVLTAKADVDAAQQSQRVSRSSICAIPTCEPRSRGSCRRAPCSKANTSSREPSSPRFCNAIRCSFVFKCRSKMRLA